jgi:hypothetical protein
MFPPLSHIHPGNAIFPSYCTISCFGIHDKMATYDVQKTALINLLLVGIFIANKKMELLKQIISIMYTFSILTIILYTKP